MIRIWRFSAKKQFTTRLSAIGSTYPPAPFLALEIEVFRPLEEYATGLRSAEYLSPQTLDFTARAPSKFGMARWRDRIFDSLPAMIALAAGLGLSAGICADTGKWIEMLWLPFPCIVAAIFATGILGTIWIAISDAIAARKMRRNPPPPPEF